MGTHNYKRGHVEVGDQTPAPPAAPETPALEDEAAASARRTKERKWKKRQEEEEASPPASAQIPIMDVRNKEKKKKKRKTSKLEQEQTPDSAETPILEQGEEAKRVKKLKEQEQPQSRPSGQSPLPSHSHPASKEQQEAHGPKCNSVVKRSNSKKHRVLSNHEIIKMRIELRKQQMLTEGFLAPIPVAYTPNSSSNHSSPFGAFFDQFCYKPVSQDRSTPLPITPDRLARLPPRVHPPSKSSQLNANGTSKTAKAKVSTASKKKQPGSGSASSSQERSVMSKDKEKPQKKTGKKKQRKPPPLLSSAEKRSDKYRRLPLDQLVTPPRSPHKLLQEKYASDPWKVIVICMLLNLTQGKQVRKKVKGFFKRYPDAHTAYNADPKKMAGYLEPLGLQRVKTNRIQKFSKEYVEKQWTYITELCGVGKYAADAYAIFCAGRATEVTPEDHKLVDYWKYVCLEFPIIQRSQRAGGWCDRADKCCH